MGGTRAPSRGDAVAAHSQPILPGCPRWRESRRRRRRETQMITYFVVKDTHGCSHTHL